MTIFFITDIPITSFIVMENPGRFLTNYLVQLRTTWLSSSILVISYGLPWEMMIIIIIYEGNRPSLKHVLLKRMAGISGTDFIYGLLNSSSYFFLSRAHIRQQLADVHSLDEERDFGILIKICELYGDQKPLLTSIFSCAIKLVFQETNSPSRLWTPASYQQISALMRRKQH